MISQFLDILFPPRCAGCQMSGYILCPSCNIQIRPLLPPICHRCGLPLAADDICKQCQYNPIKLTGLRTVSVYQEPLRSCIHALKYDGNTRIAEPLGQLLAQACLNYGMGADAIIPVPLHSERQQQRGYNHAYLLAEVCASRVRIPLRNDILIRHRATPAQVGLKHDERRQNMSGAFLCTPAFATGTLKGCTILLVAQA